MDYCEHLESDNYELEQKLAEKTKVIELMAIDIRLLGYWAIGDTKEKIIAHYTARAREGQPERKEEACKWTWDADHDVWNMGCRERIAAEKCGYRFYKFCPSCGKKIEKEEVK